MAGKRRRPSTTETGVTKPKRAKFTLDSVRLPETSREGVVLVTGAGDCGQLGLGPDIYEKNRPALLQLSHEIVDICAGGMHTVCLTKEGKVLTFGCNDEGALGRITEGIEDSECTPGEVELPGKVIQISAGDSHSAALLDDGRVFAWGTFRDSHGNMGLTLKGNEKLPYEIIQDVHVIKVASGAEHIVFLTNHGEIYTCGCAEQGQLGRTSARGCTRNARSGMGKGQIAKLLQPSLINLKPSLKLHFDNIWAGTYGTFAKVAGKNDIYVCGLNNYNQIGLKSLDPQYLPKLSKEFSKYKWNMICSAQHHTIALDENGKTFAIGRKEYGRLGLGNECDDASELTEIPILKDKSVIHIACGSTTSFAVTDTGELYGWGMGTNGQLGTGGEDDCFEPTLIKNKQLVDRPAFKVSGGGQHTVILATNTNNNKGAGDFGHELDVYEKNRCALLALQMSHEIVDICVGGMHTVCLTEEGKVFTFGCNDEGALGRITVDIEDSEYTPGEVKLPGKVIQISARDSHSAALLDDGRVFAWGTFQDLHGKINLTLEGNEKLPNKIIQDLLREMGICIKCTIGTQ